MLTARRSLRLLRLLCAICLEAREIYGLRGCLKDICSALFPYLLRVYLWALVLAEYPLGFSLH